MKQKVKVSQGTYRYVFRLPVPKIGLNGKKLPATFFRTAVKNYGFFKIQYRVTAFVAQQFPYSDMRSLSVKVVMNESKATQQRTMQLIKDNWNYHVSRQVEKVFLMHAGGVHIGVQLEKSWFNIGEDMRLMVSVDNTRSCK